MPSINASSAIAVTAFALAACGEPHRAAAQQYLTLAEGVLIANGICASASDCQRKELLFWEGGEVNLGVVGWGGAYVNLYATQDPALVDAIVSKFKEAHTRQPDPQVTLTVFSSPHSQPEVQFRKVVLK
ncbi:hypothetical protein EZJ19_07140 [Parasulfuritortus cantonensis]|uniref:Uncharacterized protein n=1 Tax=Parasulfuritortus cantonensis TaxID=2528202 RepID=A0A4R1BE84_9PROT|nr:hypothetical protein [Parasulfuritortus cantonensis]TCJ15383.1 hypothetical protein EZJ19_07140 [Parasulfuritortus cantonensis]